jgi:hypothetical protein
MALMPGPFRISREVYVPQLENGFLHYQVMEIIAASDFDSGWALKDLSHDGMEDQKCLPERFNSLSDGANWMGSEGNLD